MTLAKILGIGSPFGDDQVGWKVVEVLKQQLLKYSNIIHKVIIESHDRPGIRLIELMSGIQTVFIVDAVKSGNKIGTIHCFKNDDIFEFNNKLSTHGIGIKQALQLANVLNVLPERVVLYGIEIDKVELEASSLTLCVENAAEQVAMRLEYEIMRLFCF